MSDIPTSFIDNFLSSPASISAVVATIISGLFALFTAVVKPYFDFVIRRAEDRRKERKKLLESWSSVINLLNNRLYQRSIPWNSQRAYTRYLAKKWPLAPIEKHLSTCTLRKISELNELIHSLSNDIVNGLSEVQGDSNLYEPFRDIVSEETDFDQLIDDFIILLKKDLHQLGLKWKVA